MKVHKLIKALRKYEKMFGDIDVMCMSLSDHHAEIAVVLKMKMDPENKDQELMRIVMIGDGGAAKMMSEKGMVPLTI